METTVRYDLLSEDFWLKKLKAATYHPLVGNRESTPPSIPQKPGQWTLPIPGPLMKNLYSFSGASEEKTFLVFLTALNILVHRYLGIPDVLVCTTASEGDEEPGSDRDSRHDRLLFFRTAVHGDLIVRDLLNSTLQDLNETFDYSQYDYESFRERFAAQHIGQEKALTALGLIVDGFNPDRHSPRADEIDLLLHLRRTAAGFMLCTRYNKHDYQQDQVSQLSRHFMKILEQIVEEPDLAVKYIRMLSHRDRRQLLEEFKGKPVAYHGEEQVFLPGFENRVQKTPQAVALEYGEVKLSYRQLNEIANQLAGYFLKEAPIAADDLIAIVMERSEKMAASIIAAWKLGAAYIPLDPGFPPERIKSIIEDSGAKLLVTDPGSLPPGGEDLVKPLTRVICPEQEEQNRQKEDKTNLGIAASPHDLAYVIYTSGSTGKPKGVMVEQRGMMNHLYAKIDEIRINSASVIAQNASHCFDISVWQFFTALLEGGRAVIYPDRLVLSPKTFIESAEKDSVTILEVVPSYLSMLMEIIAQHRLQPVFTRLQYLLVTGETLRPMLVQRWFATFPGISLVNAYGPTEASDDITHHQMSRYPGEETIPIGKTLRNFLITIVDPHMNLCPVGVKGEICVTGTGVGRGYLNRPALTAETFAEQVTGTLPRGDRCGCDNKTLLPGVQGGGFLEKSPPGRRRQKIYKTGDLGRFLPDGNIEFFGRRDYQVKIRGYRIEPEEIENKLSGQPGVKEAVVLPREDKTGNRYLCGYITIKPGNGTNPETLKNELRKTLPEYMVPTHIMVMETLPLTPNGKIDRNALPEPDASGRGDFEYTPPRNPLEKELTRIWQEVLGIEKPGIDDNFFNLGGDSFKGIRIVNKIQEWLKEVVHVTILFLAPTIRELAVKLESYKTVKHSYVDREKIHCMREIIRAHSLPPLPPGSPPRKNPPAMFILCPPRSGSTLLRVILAGHPKLFAPQEFELMTFNTLQERKKGLSGKFAFYMEGVIRAIMEIKQVDAEEAKNMMEQLEERNMSVREFYRLVQTWLKDCGDRVLVEKTPAYAIDPEILNRAEVYFDSPLYIHLVRNPYAMIHSFENAKLDQIFKYEHDFSPRELAELVWLISHENIREFLKRIPGARKYQVKYETLVNRPEAVITGLCAHFGLEYYPGMIQVYKKPGSRMTDGIYSESKMLGDVKFFTHSTINTSAVEKWKEKYNIEFLGEAAVQMAKSFGYLEEKIRYAKIEAAPKKDYYELSRAQKRLWILNRLAEKPIAYNIPKAYLVEGDLNIDGLEKSYREVVRRHQSLRTAFTRVQGQPGQKIEDFETIGFQMKYIDLRNDVHRQKQAEELASEEAAAPFDLEQAPLVRIKLIHLEEKKYLFLFTMHHIISDGWSMRLLVNEILNLYHAYENNRENPLSPLRLQYKDYSQWQHSAEMRKALKGQEQYWLKEFSGEIPLINIPTDYSRPPLQDFTGSFIRFELSPGETRALNQLARTENASLYMVLLAINKVFLAKISGQEDIVVGTAAAGRPHPDLEQIIGMFVNTMAIRSCPAEEKTFITFLREVKEKILMAFENQDYPFEELVEKINLRRDLSRNPLFDVMFVLQNFLEAGSLEDNPGQEITGLQIKPFAYELKIAKFDLTVFASELAGRLYVNFEYGEKLFRRQTIARFVQYFKAVIRAVTGDPGKKISTIEIISPREKKQVLVDFNRIEGETGVPREKTIHGIFKEQTQRTPDRTALIGENPKPKAPFEQINARGGVRRTHPINVHLTYRELDEKSARLASLLNEEGVKPDTIVGIMTERSPGMILGILAILKAGGAYLPIDLAYPQDRVDFILKDSHAKIRLTSREIEILSSPRVFTDRPEGAAARLHRSPWGNAPAASLAYIIYTSGTTGKPKGIMTTHANVLRVVRNTNYIRLEEADRLLQLSNYAFDGSVFDIYGALLNSAVLVMVQPEDLLAADRLARVITRQAITVFFLTTALFNTLVELETGCFRHTRQILFGGERVSVEHTGKALAYLGKGRIIHVYGPTETTVYATYYFIEEIAAHATTIPIGKPISKTTVYILDKNLHPVPIGIIAELYLGGEGTARGYLNNPELTNKKFLQGGPGGVLFSKSAPPGRRRQKIYKTGDLARWLPDGNIEFIGRIDHQVKLRGFRIELEEIESRLTAHGEIKEAKVIVKDEQGTKSLYAYIVPVTAGTGIRKEFEAREFKEYLSKKLPGFMVPAYFIQLEKMPMTATGKVDRGALAELGNDKILPGSAATYVAPQTGKEKIIARVWQDILKLEKVGIHDNFFDLGGNSLTIIQLHDRLKKTLNREIPVAVLFRYLTIEAFLGYLTRDESREREMDTGSDRAEELRRSRDRVKKRVQIRKGV